MDNPSEQHFPSAAEAYEVEVVKAPAVKRLAGTALSVAVGVVGAGSASIPYRGTQLVVKDRTTGEVVGAIVPLQADATDDVALAYESWAHDSKLDFDRRWLELPE